LVTGYKAGSIHVRSNETKLARDWVTSLGSAKGLLQDQGQHREQSGSTDSANRSSEITSVRDRMQRRGDQQGSPSFKLS
jgi:hypothetical protein